MPPAMGQPITVVEKPSSTPGVARFETNRSLTGMGHERYASVDDILDDRPVDELARRLFDSGGVTQVHANGSMVTVHLADGWTGEKLLDVIRGLYIYYPPAAAAAAPAPDGSERAVEAEPEAASDGSERAVEAAPEAESDGSERAVEGEPDAAAAPESVADRATAVASSEAVTEPVDERVTTPDVPRSGADDGTSDR